MMLVSVYKAGRTELTSSSLPWSISWIPFQTKQQKMQYQNAGDGSLPRSSFRDGSAVTPLFPTLSLLGGRGSLGGRDLAEELPQF